jgi:hypothetical protein
MTEFEFEGICTALHGTFGKAINPATKNRTWLRVKHIPGIYVKDIVERLEDTKDSMPMNLGKAILDIWCAIDSHAGEGAAKGCANCDGDGTITGYRKDPNTGQVNTYVCTCERCYPGHKYAGNRGKMLSLGYMVCPSGERKVQAKWWNAYQKHVVEWSKARGAEGGNLVPGDILASFDRMRAATTEASA